MPDAFPTYHANFVTSNLNVDELVLELRRADKPHRENLTPAGEAAAPLTFLRPLTPQEILAVDPVARVVMTFSAARSLKQFLDGAFDRAEHARRTGTQLQ
jgi:hypothetical protein